MPNDNNNQPQGPTPSSPQDDMAPVFVTEESLPPITSSDISSAQQPTPSVSSGDGGSDIKTESPADENSGSAAPSEDIVPPVVVSSGSKSVSNTKKYRIATILSIVGLLGVTTYFATNTQIKQYVRSFAKTCEDIGNPAARKACRIATTGSPDASDASRTNQVYEHGEIIVPTVPGASETTCPGGLWCAGCGGFCLSGSYTGGGCNNAQMAKCGQPAEYGANVVSCSGSHAKECYCDPVSSRGSDNPGVFTNTPTCFDKTGSCSASDGLCAVNQQVINGGANSGGRSLPCGTKTTYYCGKNVDLSGGKSCDTSTGGTTSKPSGFCGVVQEDTACGGFKTTVIPCDTNGTGGSTPTAQCQNVKAYDTNWAPLTATQLSHLKAGDKVRFSVAGSATSGNFTKARFTINGALRPEVTAKKTGTNEFYDEYTLLAGDKNVTVVGEIYHETLGWKK